MTKVDVFSGFLGAGKTTLIKKLIKEAYNTEKIVLIENEFGEIGIDGGFLKDADINVTEMNSGCICCSLVGDFAAALNKVISEFSPDRIIIEPSGVGKLSDVIKAINGIDNKDIVLNSAVAVVDAKKCKMYMKNFGEFYNNQIENAATIVLSRTDLLTEEAIENAVHLIREKNEHCEIIVTPLNKLSGEQILSVMEKKHSLEAEISEIEHEHHHHHEEECECGCHHHHHHEHHHHDHHADEVFESIGIETVKKFSEDRVKEILNKLSDTEKYGTVLRAKGYLASEDEWIYFDFVPEEADIRTGCAQTIGRICVIGHNINKNALNELFVG